MEWGARGQWQGQAGREGRRRPRSYEGVAAMKAYIADMKHVHSLAAMKHVRLTMIDDAEPAEEEAKEEDAEAGEGDEGEEEQTKMEDTEGQFTLRFKVRDIEVSPVSNISGSKLVEPRRFPGLGQCRSWWNQRVLDSQAPSEVLLIMTRVCETGPEEPEPSAARAARAAGGRRGRGTTGQCPRPAVFDFKRCSIRTRFIRVPGP